MLWRRQMTASGVRANSNSGRLDDSVQRLEIRIFLGQLAESRIHPEADPQMLLRVVKITQQRIVAPHVVIIDRLFQERDRPRNQELLGRRGFAQLMQAKSR